MITKNALYTFTENLIENSDPTDALFEAQSFRNLRGSINQEKKTVRIEILEGVPAMTDEDKRKELVVSFTAQFWVLPTSADLTDLDEATDTSYDMARQFFEAMAEDPGLGGAVCDAYVDTFETGQASISSTVMAITYLDGTINRTS